MSEPQNDRATAEEAREYPKAVRQKATPERIREQKRIRTQGWRERHPDRARAQIENRDPSKRRENDNALRVAKLERTREYEAEYQRRRRREGKAYVIQDPLRIRAHRMVRDALKRGALVKPTSCEKCGKEDIPRRIHGHHPDYNQPLHVWWLCSICHGKEHRKYA